MLDESRRFAYPVQYGGRLKYVFICESAVPGASYFRSLQTEGPRDMEAPNAIRLQHIASFGHLHCKLVSCAIMQIAKV
jgi:hypothetical protein